jgi:glucokinase
LPSDESTHTPDCIVGDIGGSTARFALAERSCGRVLLRHVTTQPCADYGGLAEALDAFLAGLGPARPSAAAVAIAGPVVGDMVDLTNHPWSFSIEATRRRLGLARFTVINDFTAIALSLPMLAAADLVPVGGGRRETGKPMAAIGPGTGLGVSGLVRADGRWVALESEGGHATFAPMTERESRVADVLRRRYGHVSWERVLSGPGLLNLHSALTELDGREDAALSPEAVAERGLAGSSPTCREALAMFCAALGTAAGSLALTLGARGGVFIAGGIVPRLGEYFAASEFRARFENKGRLSGYVRAIPTFVVTAANPGLIGAAMALGDA